MPTPLPLSPLQLKEHRFTTVYLQAVDGGDKAAEPSLVPAIWHEQVPGNPNQWRLALTLKLGSQDPAKPFAYEAEFKVQGVVQVAANFLQERKEQLALVNGFSLLYSAAREMLLTLTTRSVKGAVLLPTLSFVALVKDSLKQKEPPTKPDASNTQDPTAPGPTASQEN